MAILQRNKTATGEGVALPEHQGGIPPLLHPQYLSRILIHSHDVTRFDLSPKTAPSTYPPLPFSTKFDLILLDAHRFDTGDEHLVPWEPERMYLAQLIAALDYIELHGVIFVRLGNIERDITVAILYLFSLLLESVKVYKPTNAHVHRGSFYGIADGYKASELKDNVQTVLRNAWWESTFGGPDGAGVNPGEWWAKIFPTEELPELFGATVVDLAVPLWQTQIRGLEQYFIKHGVVF